MVAAAVVRPAIEATMEMGLLSMFRRRNGPIGVCVCVPLAGLPPVGGNGGWVLLLVVAGGCSAG